MDRVISSKPPELLDDGVTIARRIIQLPDRDEDVGAVLLCHLLWRVHEQEAFLALIPVLTPVCLRRIYHPKTQVETSEI